MSVYPIERWDVVMSGNSITRVPMIYIKPTMEFLEFARANNFVVLCRINGTGTVYDGKEIPGVVDKSCYVPSCRPNFCEKTGLYVISLWANWYGYPEPNKLGNVEFSGMKANPDTSYKHSGPSTPNKKENNPVVRQTNSPDSNVNTGIIISSSVGVLAIIVILILVFVVK
jgi:hypothetical protein